MIGFNTKLELLHYSKLKNVRKLDFKMIAIVDYGDVCIEKVTEAVKKVTDDFIISRNEVDICRCDKIIFAGCGSAAVAMKKIHLLNLYSVLRIVKKPMLGIGLGMQLMADYSTEGNISCLGILPGTAIKFKPEVNDAEFKGFKKVTYCRSSALFNGIEDNTEFYFNNSYYLPNNNLTTSTCQQDFAFCSSMENENSYAVQFHPEMSGDAGLTLLKNFIEMK
ncbi:MAG TPA: imidazole glycerol phosphate synthase subunit HisH [Ignavibacteriales bacterium]|nr:imidazole glycerol phosphate synthase subunit HisH [Ignavibacteriales bacterium]